jgi:hypothetical protein
MVLFPQRVLRIHSGRVVVLRFQVPAYFVLLVLVLVVKIFTLISRNTLVSLLLSLALLF